ncbi:MAG: hypothetical protein DLM60_22790 [Pseudonocardiales bacterium]|nr:Asp23/Gls24 family envelope stress response protein [Actinomycetota bacterium]PZS12225.1 MAG: hypothetical protein DLM60_22790 [Pseudonocardiales bacterium]
MTAAATAHPQPTGGGTRRDTAPGGAVDPDERGRLTIHPTVLRKIAEHTADLTPGTVCAPRTMAGIGIGDTSTTATVTVTGQRVDLHLELALGYPGPVRATVDLLRRRISDELARCTGHQVRSITVTVTALLPEPTSRLP